MGVDIGTYRCRIGQFGQGRGYDVIELSITCSFSQALKQIGSVLFIGILLLVAGIEPNPGPLPEKDGESKENPHPNDSEEKYSSAQQAVDTSRMRSVGSIRRHFESKGIASDIHSTRSTNMEIIDENLASFYRKKPVYLPIPTQDKRQSKDIKETKMIKVSELPENTTKDAVTFFFENSGRSGGGYIEDVDFDHSSMTAIITFEDIEVVKCVLQKVPILFEGKQIQVEEFYPERLNEGAGIDSGEGEVDEGEKNESNSTIEVRGFKPTSTNDTIMMYFENTKRSGGCTIKHFEREEEVIRITFESEETVKKVVTKTHKVDDVVLEVQQYIQPSKPGPVNDNIVYIHGMNPKTTEECLRNFLESKAGGVLVSQIDYGEEEGTALVTFEDNPDFEKIDDACKRRSLEGSILKPAKVPNTTQVTVKGFQENTSQDTENKKGSDDVTAERELVNKEDNTCPVTLKDRKGYQDKVVKSMETKRQSPRREDCFDRFLTDLGLKKHFPGKISLVDAMSISDEKDIETLQDLPWYVLCKLIMINFRARDALWSDFMKNKLKSSMTRTFNPLDFFLVIFCCCDNHLRRVLITKLCVCRLAFPFIYSITYEQVFHFPLWGIRGLNLELPRKGTGNSSTIQQALKIVSFLRFNRPSLSKSKIVNEVLSDELHNTFFNFESPFGKTKRVLTNWLIEASWFLPSEKSKIFLDIMLFLNLRGDAQDHKTQRRLIVDTSSIVVAFINIEDINDKICETLLEITEKGIHVIFVVCSSDEEDKERIECFENIIGFTNNKKLIPIYVTCDKNVFDIKIDIRDAINALLKNVKYTSIAEFSETCKQFGIKCDEDTVSCKEGETLAKQVISKIGNTQIEKMKQKYLTSQYKLWMEYTELLKKKHKMGQALVNKDNVLCQINTKLKEIAVLGEETTPFVDTFISILLTYSNDEEKISFFVRWLKSFLDEMSREKLPGLKAKYFEAWKKVKDKDLKQAEIKKLKKDAFEAERLLSDASFGFEHIVRELGHIYESVQECPEMVSSENYKRILKLPKVIAKLLTLGFSFEIMDGDTASVPLKWIKAVMENTKIIKNANILALSILGVQSSGKSTLLNTMFGLEFSVSAGRCTRGIYMQLIPVKTSTNLKIDYVMILDTEGLRAPELADQKYDHDNQLATFAIGLGDITIVNIKGENTAEVKDVLQIVVHAFIRLRQVNRGLHLNKTCVFIHQNVSAVNASGNLMHGKQSLVNTLNQMTEEAAAQENIADITSFNQVIGFDHENHIFYFSDLWKGDPPMAPANTGYSDMCGIAKECIFLDNNYSI